MTDSILAEFEKLFLALSDKTRLRLLSLMADGEVPVGYLADKLGESQPKISRHLAYLRNSGLVNTRREGKWIYYGIASQTTAAASLLNTTFSFLSGKEATTVKRQRSTEQAGDAYRPPDRDSDTLSETDMNDWQPAEIDVFLL
jgi:ArsR family transcriptional regulator, arsenate/arsenite/antimonite-responsive transcriptional repressor